MFRPLALGGYRRAAASQPDSMAVRMVPTLSQSPTLMTSKAVSRKLSRSDEGRVPAQMITLSASMRLSRPSLSRTLTPLGVISVHVRSVKAWMPRFSISSRMLMRSLIWAVEASQPLISMTVTSCPFMDR